MLTEEEKTRILTEEQYRNEIRKKFKSKLDLVETFIKILQGLAIIAGIGATYYAYRKQSNENRMREMEQLQYYAEAAEATSTLATEEKGSEDYLKARKTFYRLFWGRLSLVEDKTVEARMKRFDNLLKDYEQENGDVSRTDLEQASLRLSRDASKYIITVWLDSTERKNYNR